MVKVFVVTVVSIGFANGWGEVKGPSAVVSVWAWLVGCVVPKWGSQES